MSDVCVYSESAYHVILLAAENKDGYLSGNAMLFSVVSSSFPLYSIGIDKYRITSAPSPLLAVVE